MGTSLTRLRTTPIREPFDSRQTFALMGCLRRKFLRRQSDRQNCPSRLWVEICGGSLIQETHVWGFLDAAACHADGILRNGFRRVVRVRPDYLRMPSLVMTVL